MACSGMLEAEVGVAGSGRGGGHTTSLSGSGTKSRVFLYRYFLSSDSPGGGNIAGSWLGRGFQP